MIIYLSLLVCVVGALAYGLSTNPKISEMGRIMFGVGLFAFLLQDAALLTVLKR